MTDTTTAKPRAGGPASDPAAPGPRSELPAAGSASYTEAIRALRTHIMALHVHAGRRGLAICAPEENVGCTFVATNLAIALSQAGLNTLLVDGNLRTPGVQKLIPINREVAGLRGCLQAEGSLVSEFIEEDVLPNLSVMYAGAPAPNAQDLLANSWFEHVVNSCLRDYEITIIDTPAGNTCADARRISTVLGYSLIVTRRNQTMINDVKLFIEQLRRDHAVVVGTVLNYG